MHNFISLPCSPYNLYCVGGDVKPCSVSLFYYYSFSQNCLCERWNLLCSPQPVNQELCPWVHTGGLRSPIPFQSLPPDLWGWIRALYL